MIELVSTFDLNGDALYEQAIEVLDLDQFVRTFTATSIVGQNDTYTRQASPSNPTNHNEHNLRLFENPEDGKFLALPWDLDRVFQLGVTDTLWGTFGTLSKLFELPQVQRLFYGHADDIINNVYTSSYVNQWGIHYGDLLNDNGDFNTERNYVFNRSSYLLGLLPDLSREEFNFAITTNSGNDFSVASSQVTLQGTGSYKIQDLFVDGLSEPVNVTWIDDSNWQVTLNLEAGTNDFTIRAHDYSGNEIHSDSISVTSTSNSTLARDILRITEINYNPSAPTATEIAAGFTDNNQFEFLELTNISGSETVDLSGLSFTDGIVAEFPSVGAVQLEAGSRALVVQDLAAFTARYGANVVDDASVIIEILSGKLSNSGETIELSDANSIPILEVSYEDGGLWSSWQMELVPL